MALLGLLLILASGALAAGIVLGTTGDSSTQVAWFDQLTRDTTVAAVFGLGAAAGVALLLGLWLLSGGLKRGRRRRVERKRLAAERRDEAAALEERNAELERKLALTRSAAERRDTLNGDGTTDADYTPYPDEPVTAEDTTAVGGRHRRR
jgi:hypothetical protein